jgi:hypothetical protein
LFALKTTQGSVFGTVAPSSPTVFVTKVLSVRLNELHPPRLPNRAAEACPHQYIHEISIVGRHLRQPMVLARLRSTATCHWLKVERGTSVFLNGFGAFLIAGFCNRNAFRLVQLCEECPSPALNRQASLIENRMSIGGDTAGALSGNQRA